MNQKLEQTVQPVQIGFRTYYLWEVTVAKTWKPLAGGIEQDRDTARNKADRARIALSGICG